MPDTPETVLTRPIIGIENRTPLEVFDIMCDRIKRTPSSATPEVSELCAKLRHRDVLRKGETVMLDMGDGPKPVSTGDTVQVRNPDGDEAATALETLEARVRVLEEALSFYGEQWVDASQDQRARGWDTVPSTELVSDAGYKARAALLKQLSGDDE